MRIRFLQRILRAAALTGMGALAITTPLRAQSGKTWTMPKTSWGDPDLQGVWPATDSIGIPMQRPLQFGTRSVLTEEEFADREKRAAQTAASDKEEFANPNAPVGINPPAYWLERGKPSRQASLVVDPPDGRIPPLIPQAQTLQDERAAYRKTHAANESWTDQSYYDRCISRGVMGSILPVIYNNGNQILQAPGLVVIRYEMIHETRVIPLDGRPHVAEGVRSYMGDARGHWEGNTLVVETTNFLGGTNGIGLNGNGVPHSAHMRLVERFTRTGQNTIDYTATIDDPATWTKPFTIAFPLKRDPSYFLAEYACHEGNYAMIGILKGGRAEEKESEKKSN